MLHLNLADQYQHRASPIHQLDARVKLAGALAFIVTSTLLPPGAWTALGLLLAAALLAAWGAGLGWAYALKKSYIVLPFAVAAITLPFTMPGTGIAQVAGLTLSAEGTVRFISILIKSWISIQMAILLSATTAVPALLWALRALRVPQVFVSIIGFMYRYLFVLGDEALRLLRARAARSGVAAGAKGGGSLAWRGKVAGGMAGNLALRAFERSERIYDAMVARGFQGELKTLSAPVMTARDWNCLVGWMAFLAVTALLGFIF